MRTKKGNTQYDGVQTIFLSSIRPLSSSTSFRNSQSSNIRKISLFLSQSSIVHVTFRIYFSSRTRYKRAIYQNFSSELSFRLASVFTANTSFYINFTANLSNWFSLILHRVRLVILELMHRSKSSQGFNIERMLEREWEIFKVVLIRSQYFHLLLNSMVRSIDKEIHIFTRHVDRKRIL